MPGPITNCRARGLPGQRRHPAALNTFIFPPGRFRRPDSGDGNEDKMRKKEKKTMGRKRLDGAVEAEGRLRGIKRRNERCLRIKIGKKKKKHGMTD